MSSSLLVLQQFGVSFSGKAILQNISLAIGERGMWVLMGPVGSGKSTLLRTLAGLNRASQALKNSGVVHYCGEVLLDDSGNFNSQVSELPAIVAQKTQLLIASVRENIVGNLPERGSLTQQQQRELVARLLIQAGLAELAEQQDILVKDLSLGQQRLIALIRTMACNPRLVLVDEPTAGVSEADAALILTFLKQQAERRAIITVLHNQQQAKTLGSNIELLVEGRIIEQAACADFFAHADSELGQMFVRTGSCCTIAKDVIGDEDSATESLPRAMPSKSYSTRPTKPCAPTENTAANCATNTTLPAVQFTSVAGRYQQPLNAVKSAAATASTTQHSAAARAVPTKNQPEQTQLSLPLNPQVPPIQHAEIRADLNKSLLTAKHTAVTQIANPSSQARVSEVKGAGFGPRNFHWLLPGKLAGTPRPGLIRDVEQDLSALARVGISQLISLESEFPACDNQLLAQFGISGFSLPMPDMKAPAMDEAFACCQQVADLIAQGECVAFHCKAGIGRTGTMLVAYLIYSGQPAAMALTSARAIEPRWVQSPLQENFLAAFATYAANTQKNVEISSTIDFQITHTTT